MKNQRILLIDDDEDDLQLFREIITEHHPGCQLLTAHNGLEALQRLEAIDNLPGLILMDLNMPLLDGKQTLESFRAQAKWRDLPVVVFSTACREEDQAYFLERGVELIQKPRSYQGLVEILARLVKHCLQE